MHVYKEFTDIDWKVLFKDSKNVICFFTYAYSWRSNNRSALNMLKEQGTSITIILPNYNNDSVVDALNQDFKYGKYAQSGEDGISKEVKNLIQEAETYFKNFGATVKLYNGNIKTTYYLVDNKCIMAPFKHGEKNLVCLLFYAKKEEHYSIFVVRILILLSKNLIEWESFI